MAGRLAETSLSLSTSDPFASVATIWPPAPKRVKYPIRRTDQHGAAEATAEASAHLVVAHRLQPADLVDLALDEGLAAEAGVDAHDEHKVEHLKHLLDGRQGGAGVEHGAREAPEVLDLVEAAVQVDGGGDLGVHRDDVRAGLRKVRNAELWLDDHLHHGAQTVARGC